MGDLSISNNIHAVKKVDGGDGIDGPDDGNPRLPVTFSGSELDRFDRYQQIDKKPAVPVPVEVEDADVPIILNVEDNKFLLLQIEDYESDYVCLFDDADILNHTILEFFKMVRSDEDLSELHTFKNTQELVLTVPQLHNIRITEDNIYSRNILINDFTKIFNALLYQSTKKANPKFLDFKITAQTRFITHFNDLNDLIRSGQGFNEPNGQANENNDPKEHHDNEPPTKKHKHDS